MFNVRYFAADGAETPVQAAKFEVSGDTIGAPVTVKVWANLLDAAPSHEWTGTRGDGSAPGQPIVHIANRFGTPLDTVYFSAMA